MAVRANDKRLGANLSEGKNRPRDLERTGVRTIMSCPDRPVWFRGSQAAAIQRVDQRRETAVKGKQKTR